MSVFTFLKSIFSPLSSRKVRVAFATIIAAYAAKAGLLVTEDMIYTILGVGMSLILGIAHEDAAKRSASF